MMTRSNLLVRLLETHPQIMSKQYPFMISFQRGPESQWPAELKEAILEASGMTKEEAERVYAHLTYQTGLDGLQKGKISVIKEHTVYMLDSKMYTDFFRTKIPPPVIVDRKLDVIGDEVALDLPSPPFPNPTVLPDRLVATMLPIIVIRHPMFTFPSFARATSTFGQTALDTDFEFFATFRWQRMIYDFYRAYYDKVGSEGKESWPVVVDGDKLVEDTQGQMKQLCALIGLTESEIQYSWDSSARPRDRVVDAFVGDFNQSTGVIKGPASSRIPDLDEQVKKWAAEWNEEIAQKMKETVESSMEDYEYLFKRSSTAPAPAFNFIPLSIVISTNGAKCISFPRIGSAHQDLSLLSSTDQIQLIYTPVGNAPAGRPESQWPDELKETAFKGSGMTKEEGEEQFAHFTYQAALDNIEKLFAEAQEKGKFCVVKEHTVYSFDAEFLKQYVDFGQRPRPAMVDRRLDVIGTDEIELQLPSPPFPNPTVLPDRLVATVTPVIIIRHPAYTFASYLRAAASYGGGVHSPEFELSGSLRWQRIIYDFYRAYYDKIDAQRKKAWPIVIDGDELVQDTRGQMKKFCELVGLSESEIQYSWESTGRPTDRLLNAFIGTIKESTGVIKGPNSLRDPNLDEQTKNWTEEWGEEIAGKLREAVTSSLDDYQYLRARCL
ncbi:hypothetical protein D9757_001093 [Collybiopsis confluens]|uniref:Uncharacterized protein n=1 Tax=Collybiopsis confluens TaxID=2823264 RepID=A0A8H5MGL2_9AGAR|nr:hypothetical protein D9757_001093 [Collybiopsis confluens]